MGEEVRGLRSTNSSHRIAVGMWYSTGNGAAKELTHRPADMNNGGRLCGGAKGEKLGQL